MTKGRVIALGIGLALLFVLASCIGTYVSTRNDGINQELALTRQYKDMMAGYGTFRTTAMDQLNIAREKRDAIDSILKDVMEGRAYVKKDGSVDSSALVLAITEKYPDLTGLNIYDQVLTTVQAGRTRFAKDQRKLSDQVRSYNDWRSTGGLLHPVIVSLVGFPSTSLEVRIGNNPPLTGQAALDKMSEVIITKDTQDIFNNGQDQGLDLQKR